MAIFTPAPDHVRHCVAAMNAGKHVICAVPAAMSLEECEQLLAAKKRNDRKFMMAETSYYRYHTLAARELFNQGKFGEMFYSEVEYYHQLFNLATVLTSKTGLAYGPDGKRSWRWGLPHMLYPTHSLGYLTGVTGERITKVSCLGW